MAYPREETFTAGKKFSDAFTIHRQARPLTRNAACVRASE